MYVKDAGQFDIYVAVTVQILGMGKHRVGDAVDRSADIMARLLGWDAARRTDEIARYLAALYPPATPQTKAQGQ